MSRLAELSCAVLLAWSSAFAIEIDPQSFADASFDYIVVGGGTTGLALASRLSDDLQTSVGVIEAGPYIEDYNILVPGLIGSTLGNPEYDWMFTTTPQPYLNGRQLGLGRGKLLGGTSALNYMAHTRASAHEYDGWETLGNPGWNFTSIQSYIKKSENWSPPEPYDELVYHANDDFWNHGTSGRIRTGSYTYYSDVVQPYFEALNNLGVRTSNASNGGDPIGVWSVTGTVDPYNVTRSYSTTGYYEPFSSRENLVVLTGSQAMRVVFGNSTEEDLVRATGVTYHGSDGLNYTVRANKEVILSAGTIQTPQLLELSGIGDATYLQTFGISPVVDLPGVGNNLQDHPGVLANFQALSNLTTLDELNNSTFAAEQFSAYLGNRTGMYSSTPSTLLFIPLEQFVPDDVLQQLRDDLDDAIQLNPSYNKTTFMLERSWMEDPRVPHLEMVLFPALEGANFTAGPNERYYTTAILFLHCWSRGNVHINTSDPLSPPSVDFQYLDAPANYDARVLVEALKFARNISQTDPMSTITSAIIAPASADDEYLESFLKDALVSEYHFIGTAAMLPRSEEGVVDPNLLVYGTSNLRVVDASIMPLHVGAHPTAALYGIAEKAADIIRSSAGY